MTNKSFYKKILLIAIPIALQNLITVGVSMADTVMLGSVGEVALSASSLANQLFFIFTLVIYGTAGGSNVLVAQYWGKQDVSSIKKVLGYTYRVIIFISVIMTILAAIFPQFVMGVFTNDTAVIEQGTNYLRIISISYIFFGIATISTRILCAVGTVKISLYSAIASLCINVFLNWVLIFGNFGFPALGVTGAAIATTIARISECIIVLIYMRFKETKIKLRIHELYKLDHSMKKAFVKNSTPVICNELLWSCGTALLSVIIGRMGTAFVASYSIYNVVSQLACVTSQGLAAAAAVIVGNAIGAKQYKEMKFITNRLQIAAIVTGIFSFFFVLLIRPTMPYIYHISSTSMEYLMQILLIGAVMEAFRPIAFVNMVGILRGGGDAKFVLVNDIIFLWTICLPLGFFAGLVWKLPVPLVFLILRFDDMIKVITSSLRLKYGKWMKNVTEY
ncbi:MAG: MATE family efflux transporter [Longicatena sp.]